MKSITKSISIILFVLMLMSALAAAPFTVSAETVESGKTGDCTWKLDEDGTLTISGNGQMQNYDQENAEFSCICESNDITTVVIENGVKNIGSNAFVSCDSLRSVVIPESVTSIGSKAFYRCTNLSDVHIPAKVQYIGNDAFGLCQSLTSVVIPGSVEVIADGAFQNCLKLKYVTILDGVKTIGFSAFVGCADLIFVAIPGSVTSISGDAFWNWSAGETIYGIANSEANRYADSLKIPFKAVVDFGTTGDCVWALEEDGTLTISGVGATQDYNHDNPAPWGTGITAIVLHDGITHIGNDAFLNCQNLMKITLIDE